MFAPLSGAGMAYGFDVMNAAKMYYAKINKEGGIHGRQLELVIEDDRCNANDLVAAVKKLTEQDKVFMLNGGSCSAAVVAAREYVEREKIPLLMLNARATARCIRRPSTSTARSRSRSTPWAARWCSSPRST